MATKLGKYKSEYDQIMEVSKSKFSSICEAVRKSTNQNCCLKIIDLKELEKGDYDFHLKRLKTEEEVTKICNSENTVNFIRKLEVENYLIFELEQCDETLENYMNNQGELENDKKFFKIVVQDLVKALYSLHKKGIMHRDIKPANIFVVEKDGKKVIKLGDFGCAIYIQDNQSDPIGTYTYNSPEQLKNLEYDDKCDIWSLGVTLFELYYGYPPYAPITNSNVILSYANGVKKWMFKKTKDPKSPVRKPNKLRKPEEIIPNLDVLFKRLLTMDPKKRMTFDELYKYVFDPNFMKPGFIAINNNQTYKKIYEEIEKEPIIIYDEGIVLESGSEEKKEKENINKIQNFVNNGNLPDIMTFSNGSIKDNKYNNIIYYDENVDKYKISIFEDCDYFEKETPGAFILCTSLESLNIIKEEIIRQIKRDKNSFFNLITTGSKCEKVMKFLNENIEFKNCIKHVCVYCMNLDKWSKLKQQYDIIYDVYSNQSEVKEFIRKFSEEKIKPYYVTKVITYDDYIAKYKERHFSIAQFYGDLTKEKFKMYLEQIKLVIKDAEKKNGLYNSANAVLEGFLTFDINKDLDELDKLIVKEYTKETFYGDLNKWLRDASFLYIPVAYFTARLMFHLNLYAKKNNLFYIQDKCELHRGAKLSYSTLLPYERAKGKIILLTSFTSSSEDEDLAKRWAGRDESKSLYKTSLKFSVVFIIKNYWKSKWISNGVNVQNVSEYVHEKEILYQPFTFYRVRDVNIDLQNFTADIYLETIGKTEILEEKIKLNKEIFYNKNKGIMEVVQ